MAGDTVELLPTDARHGCARIGGAIITTSQIQGATISVEVVIASRFK